MRILSLVVLLLAHSVWGAESGPVVLKAARMFDGKSDQLLTPGIVVVVNGKIAAADTSCRSGVGRDPGPGFAGVV